METAARRVVGLGLLLVAVAGCSRSRTPGVTESEVTLGISAPLSGPAASWSAIAAGAQAWASHVNALGGVQGRRIRVVVKDDGYVPGRAVANVTEMKDSVFAIVALLGTACINASKDLVEESGVPLVYPFGNPRVWSGEPREKLARVFVVYADYENEGALLAREAVTRAAARKVAVFYQNDDYGKDGLAGVKRGLAGSPGALVAEVPYELQDRDVSIQALKIKDSGADTVVLYSTTTHGANLVKEMTKVGYRPVLFASFPLGDYHVMYRLLGDLWDGAYFSAYGPVSGEPATERVVELLLRQDPSIKGRELFSAYGAMAMALTVEGLKRAGPSPTREAFVTAMEGIRDWKPEGLEATITFGPGRRHGLNGVRLLRAGKAAEGSFTILTDHQVFPPLY
jgi:ABC-type branched-subunit amino acid transport system substrate-binding protein